MPWACDHTFCIARSRNSVILRQHDRLDIGCQRHRPGLRFKPGAFLFGQSQ